MVTASHNPPEYNGYKVYWENGAQIIPPIDAAHRGRDRRAPPRARVVARPPLQALARKGARHRRAARRGATRTSTPCARSPVHPDAGDRGLRIVYTPLHGVGDALVRRALAEAGFTHVETVPEQQKPDGAFPTVAFPNPEETGAMDLALALARRPARTLVLANDPDVDRLAVAVPRRASGYRQLTGNEVGVLLGHYLLTEKPATQAARRPRLDRLVAAAGPHRRGPRRPLRGDAHRLQVDRQPRDRARARGLRVRLRLRGGPRLLRRRRRARQGRHLGRAARRRAGRGPPRSAAQTLRQRARRDRPPLGRLHERPGQRRRARARAASRRIRSMMDAPAARPRPRHLAGDAVVGRRRLRGATRTASRRARRRR